MSLQNSIDKTLTLGWHKQILGKQGCYAVVKSIRFHLSAFIAN